MTPLTRSLLAFAALLSVTDARMANPFCSFLRMGKSAGYPEDNYVKFTLTVAGGTITIPDKCSRPGNVIVGETISVCNTPNSKPEIWQALQTQYHFKPNFGLVHIDCPSDIAGCNHLEVVIKQYCKMVTAPH